MLEGAEGFGLGRSKQLRCTCIQVWIRTYIINKPLKGVRGISQTKRHDADVVLSNMDLSGMYQVDLDKAGLSAKLEAKSLMCRPVG